MPDYRELWMRSMLRKTEEGARCRKCGSIDERLVELALAPADFETEVAVCKECGSRVTLPATVRAELEAHPREQKTAGKHSLAWRNDAPGVDSSPMVRFSHPIKIATSDSALTGAATDLPPDREDSPMPAVELYRQRPRHSRFRVVGGDQHHFSGAGPSADVPAAPGVKTATKNWATEYFATRMA